MAFALLELCLLLMSSVVIDIHHRTHVLTPNQSCSLLLEPKALLWYSKMAKELCLQTLKKTTEKPTSVRRKFLKLNKTHQAQHPLIMCSWSFPKNISIIVHILYCMSSFYWNTYFFLSPQILAFYFKSCLGMCNSFTIESLSWYSTPASLLFLSPKLFPDTRSEK